MLRRIANIAAVWLLEPACAACGLVLEAPIAGAICPECWNRIVRMRHPNCARCGDRVPGAASGTGELACARCLSRTPPFEIARSAAEYDGALRALIHAFKYDGRRTLARPLARLMRECGAPVLDGADAVVPVPLHPLRSFSRGFNQADDLARELGLPVWRVLRRRRWRAAQASLGAEARHHNLDGVFAIRRSWSLSERRRSRLQSSTVVIVDDVMTTGATIDACADALSAIGVRTVRALTVARSVARQPPRRPTPPRPSVDRH